jgi:hypothetical protein
MVNNEGIPHVYGKAGEYRVSIKPANHDKN